MRATELDLKDQISLLSGSTFWLTEPLPAHGIAAVKLSDGPHGLRAQDGDGEHLGLQGSIPATCFPTAATIASSWDVGLVEQIGRAVGAEARALGVDVVLGPGLNIKRHPLCGRNFEYLSEDPLLSGRLAAAMVDGIQGQGVAACVKHFAVNNQESHRLVVDVVVDERTLREIYLAGFEHVVTRSRPQTVMAAYNKVNGAYCCDDPYLLTRILREQWGFEGLVMSDWGATNDRVAGVLAGMDLEMPGSGGAFDDAVAHAVADGRLKPADVAACADRVLALVAEHGSKEGAPEADLDAHDRLARRAAAQSTVLLVNDGLLPLAADQKVALIGGFAGQPRFQGSGSSQVNPVRVTTALAAFAQRGITVDYASGYDPVTSRPDRRLIDEAVAVAAQADVVVLMAGLPGSYESEGFDRTDLHLPRQQEDLIEAVCRANPRTVVALSNGSAVVMPWRNGPAAILESYLGGQASGGALVDVLYGDVEPGGRLAETFPLKQQDLASDRWFPGEPHQVEYREGLRVGYRHFATAGVEPMFAFGHGLGYTTFEMGEPTVAATLDAGEPVTVSVAVVNTGTRTGRTVVQVYLQDRTGLVARPRRELAGFATVELAPDESRTVQIQIEPRAFAFYDVDEADWLIPEGEYAIELGWSSVDIVRTAMLRVRGGFTGRRQRAMAGESDAEFAALLQRPIPVPRPVRPYTRVSTIGEISGNPIGRLVRRVVLRVSGHDSAEDPVTAIMIERSVDEMPLRGIALFSQGKVSLGMIDGLVDAVNGRPDRSILRMLRALPAAVRRRRRR